MKTIMGWVLGVGIIAFILLIMVIIFGNLQGNVGFTQDSGSFTNESITLTTTGNTPAGAVGKINPALTNVVMYNGTAGELITSGNYSVVGALISNITPTYGNEAVNVTYDISYDSQGQRDSDSIILNYTQSATNTSAQFPTVGTIIGIAILLLILIALLVFAIRKMMGVAVSGGSSNSSFGGSSREFS